MLNRYRSRYWTATVIILSVLVHSTIAGATNYAGKLGLSADGGYSALPIRNYDNPSTAHGGLSRIRVFYGLNESFGLEFSGCMGWYGDFTPKERQDVENEEGELVNQWVPLSKVSSLRTQNINFALIYTFDIMKIIPYGTVGLGSTKTTFTQDSKEHNFYDVSLYLNLGLDYAATKHLWFGLVAEMNTPLTNDAPFKNSLNVLARFTFVWQVRNLNTTGK